MWAPVGGMVDILLPWIGGGAVWGETAHPWTLWGCGCTETDEWLATPGEGGTLNPP